MLLQLPGEIFRVMLAVVILCALLLVASYTDIRSRKIPNWITYPGIIAALGTNGVGTVALWNGWAELAQLERLGYIGLGQSLLGFVTCGLILVACYIFFDIGGGDVKLLSMMGAFLGPEKGLEALLWTMALGGCLAAIIAIWQVGAWTLVKNAAVAVWNFLRWRHASGVLPAESPVKRLPLFLAPCALLATLVVAWSGRTI